jgi:chromosome segregation ATPase
MSESTADRLNALQGELTEIVADRLADLNRTLRETEQATRRIIAAEIEIGRHRAAREELERSLESIQGELDSDRTKAEEVRGQHASLTLERDKLRANLSRVEAESRDLEADVERTRGQVDALAAEAESLRNENALLRTKLKTLEENISRMQRIKDELMSSISGLTAQMSNLAGGSPE